MVGKVIYSLLSGLANGQVYPDIAPQSIEPDFITYRKISVAPTDTKDGDPLDTERWQIDVVSKTNEERVILSDSVRTALVGQSGVIEGLKIDSIRFAGEQDLYDQNSTFFRREIDFKIRLKL